MIMKLLTKGLEERFKRFPFESQSGLKGNAKVIVKYFNPMGAETWLITEAEKQDNGDYMLYGYCNLGDDEMAELGYVMLSELENIKLPLGLGIERDLYINKDCTLIEALKSKGIEIPDVLLDKEIKYAVCKETLFVFSNKESLDNYFINCINNSEKIYDKERYETVLNNSSRLGKVAKDFISESCEEIKILFNKDYSKELVHSLANNLSIENTIEYYEKVIQPILNISEEYNVDFLNKIPFEQFGNDDEYNYGNVYSLSEYYKNILEGFFVEVKDIKTEDKSDGKYIVTINDDYEFDTTACETLNGVVNNVESMVELLKNKETECEI